MEVNETSPPREASGLGKDHRRIEHEYLCHFLGPLAIAANNANFESFNYDFEGVTMRIGKAMADDLLQIANRELEIAEQIMKQLRDLELETNSEFSEFLSTPLEDVKMSTRLYHILCDAMCVTMLDVARLGTKGVSCLRRIGPKSVEEIRQIFIAHGCVELFDAEAL